MKNKYRKYIRLIHLWLGLASGLVVFIIAVTGCILAFEHEIKHYTQPWQYVQQEDKPFLLPSQLRAIAEQRIYGDSAGYPGKQITAVQYCGSKKAAIVTYSQSKAGVTLLYMNPYNGTVQKEKILNNDFFRIVLGIHFYLLLPPDIGRPLVASSILIFVVLLISGMILWWPRRWNKKSFKQGYTIKRGASFKRTNYDLHNVLGFYSLFFTLILALTGLVWGFEWYEKGLYKITSGGKTLEKLKRPLSDTTSNTALYQHPEDVLFLQAAKQHDLSDARFQLTLPAKSSDPFTTNYNPSQSTYYKREFRYYDRNSLQELKGEGIYAKAYKEATAADKLYRMNYDIHVGAIAGLAGKILAFFASLVAASLPVTGFLIWWGKRKKAVQQKKIQPQKNIVSPDVELEPAFAK